MSVPLTPAAFARIVAASTDEQLTAGLHANGEAILGEMFRQMPAQVRTEALGDLRAVVEWRVARADGHDVWQLEIADGAAAIEPGTRQEPTVTYTLAALDFLKLAAGLVEGPELFMTGRLVIDGDLFLAAQMPGLLKRPGQ